jgi:hypothetical protein
VVDAVRDRQSSLGTSMKSQQHMLRGLGREYNRTGVVVGSRRRYGRRYGERNVA